jgi:alpha-N-arabinofuranosidase
MISLKNSLMIVMLFVTVLQSSAQSFLNPILSGFYPDPSICKAGNDYYIVNSSFVYYPGLPVFHSNDLVNWQQIGYALNSPEQLNLDGAGVSRGLFAPSISYHKGVFYIVCTLVDKGGNFVITSTDPKGPWSNPVWLPQIDGIDPSIFFDENDQSYIVYNSIPPDNKTIYEGHRTIRMNAFDSKQLKVTNDNKIIVNGGTDISKKPVWIEAPHLFKKDDWYYLICAEGGTGYNHSEVVFRSKTVDGPFIPFEKNPILTQRHLDPNRKNPVTTTGHAEFVETKEGNWFAVFLACRPYEDDFYNTGRETFMAPVEWKDGWPIINPGFKEVQYSYPINATVNPSIEKFNGNFLFNDDFSNSALNNRYSFLRTVREKWYSVNNGKLALQLRAQTCSGNENPSFVGFRQPHLKGYAATAMSFAAETSNEKAGLLIFQSEHYYYFLCQSKDENGKPVMQLLKGPGNKNNSKKPEIIASVPIKLKKKKDLFLKIEANGNTYSFFYTSKKGNWQLLKSNVDGKFLSTKVAGGFVGSFYALYATSSGEISTNKVFYNWFECKSDEAVYK